MTLDEVDELVLLALLEVNDEDLLELDLELWLDIDLELWLEPDELLAELLA